MNLPILFQSIFLFFVAFKFIKCSSFDQNPPILIEEAPEMNHINVVLQCLFHSPSIRQVIYDHSAVIGFDSASSLGLALSKMHIDRKSASVSTDTSIFFKDEYLKHAVEPFDPKLFFEWSLDELSEEARGFFQIEEEITKMVDEQVKDFTINESFSFLEVDPSFGSLEAFFNDFFEAKYETVILPKNGVDQSSTMQIKKSLARLPKVLTFALGIPLQFWPDPLTPFHFPDNLKLSNADFELFSAIIYDPSLAKFTTVFLKQNSYWLSVKDGGSVVKRVAENQVFETISNFGYMAFYQDKTLVLDKAKRSPVPSVELLMQSVEKETLHSLRKTVTRQSSYESPSSSGQAVAEVVPSKTKNMTLHPNYPVFPDSPIYRGHHLSSLGARPLDLTSKTPPPAEPAYMNAILVPRNFGGVKIEWGTRIEPPPSAESTEKAENESLDDDGCNADKFDGIASDDVEDSFDDIALLSTKKRVGSKSLDLLKKAHEADNDNADIYEISGDHELDYIDNPKIYLPRRSVNPSIKSSTNIYETLPDLESHSMSFDGFSISDEPRDDESISGKFDFDPDMLKTISAAEIKKQVGPSSGIPEQPYLHQKATQKASRKNRQASHQKVVPITGSVDFNDDDSKPRSSINPKFPLSKL